MTHSPAGPALLASFAVPTVAVAGAVAAIAVPVLIHLLSRQRYQVVDWAAVRFLLAAQKAHRRRIDRWLLLAARVLALLLPLLGMLAVTPWAERLWQWVSPGPSEVVSNAPRTHRVFVLDASLSMTARADGRTRFETAVGRVEQAIRAANAGDGFSLIVLGNGAQAVVPGPATDPEKVLAELHAVPVTHCATDLSAGLALVADTLARSPRAYPRRQVVLVTDLQRTSWTGLLPKSDGSPPDLWQRILPRAEVVAVDCAGADTDNLAIADLSLADPLPLVDTPTAVAVSVQNFGRTDRGPIRLELHLGRPGGGTADGSLLPVEQRVIDSIPAGQRVTVTFALDSAARFREPGVHLLQARLVDGDDLAADDRRTLAVEVRAGLPVVVVNGQPAAEPLKRASEYLAEALAPGGRPAPGNPARPRTLSLTEFADPAIGDLSAVDCVFLCDLPTITPAQVARLEAHLKRGGGVVIGLGPNAAANAELYNRVLFNDGNGPLPGKLLGVAVDDGPDASGFRLAADEEMFRRPPLAGFRDDNARAGLVSAPFKRYVKLDAPADGKARRVLSFVPGGAAPESTAAKPEGRPDPAVVEWPRHRGRVVVYTSTFNADWTDWPILPSYLPFVHELLRFTAANPDRHTVRVGEAVEEFLPVTAVGLTAAVTGPEGLSVTVPVSAGDEVGVARYPDTLLSGLYTVSAAGRKGSVFAVNVPETTPGGGSESDLRRLDPADLKPLGPIAITADPTDAGVGAAGGELVTLAPRPHGPTLARWLLLAALVVLVGEAILAWRVGPARTAAGGGFRTEPETRRWVRWVFTLLAVVPLAAVVLVLGTLLHAEITGDLLGFVPDAAREQLERTVGVPAAGPGEGTHWRLETASALLPGRVADRRLLLGLGVAGLVLVLALYRWERRAAGRFRTVAVPFALRAAALLFALFVLLPQLRLAFDREGWPDIAVLLDTSASMATVDDLQDPRVKAKADELTRVGKLTAAERLKLAQVLLTRPDGDLLSKLLTDRQVKVHLYSIADQAKLVTELTDPADLPTGHEAVNKLAADGESSRLGDAVQAVLKAFRGGSLSAVIVVTDGVTTAGEDLPKAGREAARAGVPLYLIGTGDAREPPDLILSDIKSDDVVLKGDKLVIEARVTAKGANPPQTVPVVLYERQGERLLKLDQATVRPDPSGRPVPVRLSVTPTEAGEKSYVIDVPVQRGEAEAGNNRADRVVLVTESKRLRVLYIDGYPRYEFRFVKALLERETDAVAGNRSLDLSTLLLDASPGYAEQDKSALRAMPTRAELFEYDAVVLGDVDPAQFPKAQQTFQDLAEFVRVRGGGLLFLAGEQSNPVKYFNTPLAALLPVGPSDTPPREDASPPPAVVTGYRPKLTPFGRAHPIFRFHPDEAENAKVWAGLRPLMWAAGPYKRKATAEVLAVHPDRPAEGHPGENHPLALQQFVGAGRVLFFGFDETWRWRMREGEERFNQFWVQAARILGRGRVSRAELRTDKQTAYRRDEPIRLTVRFPDDAPAPPADQPVTVSVERTLPAGAGATEPYTVRLAKVEGSRATYQTLLTRTPEGDYRFFLTGPVLPGTRPRAEAKVLPPAGERERLEMNVADLTRAAAESRGKFYTLADAEKVVEDLPEVARVPLNQPVPPISLWDQPAAFGLVLALLGCEWVLRRRAKLV
ncbi:MAG: VWA domain-containing protein [Gemmataceae bacterium]